MLGSILAFTLAVATPAPCRVPKHEAAVMESFAHGGADEADLAIFDLNDASQTCEIRLPGSPAPDFAIAKDGTIYAAIEPHEMTRYTTDMGHLSVFSPNGRLIHRVYDGMQGIWTVQLDDRGHLFVEDSGTVYVDGAGVRIPRTFTMYDAQSLRKIRSFDLGNDWFGAAVSQDGRYLAVSYDVRRDSGRVDIIDPSTGAVLRHVSVPAENVSFDGSTLYVGSQVGTTSIQMPNGVPQRAEKHAYTAPVIDGVAYTEGSDPFVMPGQGIQTTTYYRRRVSTGARLRPIVAHGIATFPIVRTLSAAVAAATPGPDVTAPAFPRGDALERRYASAPAIAFDDVARKRHYVYWGQLARIDIPDKNVFVLVDCDTNAAVIASPKAHSYDVFSIDPPAVITPIASPQPQMIPGIAPLSWRIESLAPNQFHSAEAKTGYRIEDASRSASALLPAELNEREYAMTDVSYPSCATRTYSGEPLPIEPQRLFDLTDQTSRMLDFAGPGLHVAGRLPTLPSGALLVHAEGVQDDGTIEVAVDVKNLRAIDRAQALKQFVLPSGYTLQAVPQY